MIDLDRVIDIARLESLLQTRALGRDGRVVDEVASTMDLAHEAVAAGAPDGWLVIARHQTAGRGARGRAWSSARGASLPLSFVVRPLRGGPLLALAVGLGIAEAVDTLGVSAEVKWPNDVLVAERKLVGILVEARSTGGRAPDAAVVGVGVNLRAQDYPPDVVATDLETLAGHSVDVEAWLAVALERIEVWLDRASLAPGAVARALDQRLAWRGQLVETDDGTRGLVHDVAEDGELRLATPEGLRRVRAGRVRRV